MRTRITGALRRHATYANIVATICLFTVITGTAWAAATITGAQIKNETITGKDVKNRSLTGADIKSGVIPSYTAGDGLLKSGNRFYGKGTPYERVVVVAKSGGDYTSVQSAIDSITDATDDKRYLVWVAPGIYTERVTTQSFIDLQGAGESDTVIESTAGASVAAGAVVTIGGNNSTIRDLTIRNANGGAAYATGLYSLSHDIFTVKHVTIDVQHGTTENDATYLDTSDGSFTDVTVDAGTNSDLLSIGFNITNGSAPTITDSTIAGDGLSCIGVRQFGSTSPDITRSNISCSGDTSTFGVSNVDTGGGTTIVDSTIMASAGLGAGDATGIFTGGGDVSLQNVKVTGMSLGGNSYGVELGGSAAGTLTALGSQILGISGGVNLSVASTTVNIGGTMVVGGIMGTDAASATKQCASSWDQAYAALTC